MNATRVVTEADATPLIHWMGGKGTFFATADRTAAAFAIWRDQPVPGGGTLPHVHTREEEFFYVVKGDFKFWCAGGSFEGGPGSFAGLPKGLGHQFKNVGSTTGEILVFLVPGGGERFFIELGTPFSEPDDTAGPPDPARVAEVSAKYGQVILFPKLTDPIPGPSSADMPMGFGRSPTFRHPGDGESFAAAGMLVTLKAVAAQTLGAYSFVEAELAPGATFPTWRDARRSEGLFVLEGTLTVETDSGLVEASAESAAIIPTGSTRGLANRGDRPARFLSVTTPGGSEDFYRAAFRPVQDRPARPSDDPSDRARLASIGAPFGLMLD